MNQLFPEEPVHGHMGTGVVKVQIHLLVLLVNNEDDRGQHHPAQYRECQYLTRLTFNLVNTTGLFSFKQNVLSPR